MGAASDAWLAITLTKGIGNWLNEQNIGGVTQWARSIPAAEHAVFDTAIQDVSMALAAGQITELQLNSFYQGLLLANVLDPMNKDQINKWMSGHQVADTVAAKSDNTLLYGGLALLVGGFLYMRSGK